MLGQVGLTGDLVKIGAQLARVMVERLAGVRPEHEFFEKLGLISAEDLPLPERILRRKEKPVSRGWHRRKGHALFQWGSRRGPPATRSASSTRACNSQC